MSVETEREGRRVVWIQPCPQLSRSCLSGSEESEWPLSAKGSTSGGADEYGVTQQTTLLLGACLRTLQQALQQTPQGSEQALWACNAGLLN